MSSVSHGLLVRAEDGFGSLDLFLPVDATEDVVRHEGAGEAESSS